MSNEEQAQKDEAQPINEEATETHAEEVEEVVEELSAEQTRILELEAALAASEATLAAQKDSVMRAIADADNVRKRAEGEVDKARKCALQVADKENEAIKPVIEGVEITLKSFVSSIEKFGMKVIDPQGESFNPEQHQAMSMQENAELPANTVMAVMQKGYELNGRLLRPAMVMVSRAPEGGVDTQA